MIADEQGHTVERLTSYIGLATPIQAEYQAALLGLEAALRHGPDAITIQTGSETLFRQLQGKSSATAPDILAYYTRVRRLMEGRVPVDVRLATGVELEIAEKLAIVAVDSRGRRRAID